jgi:hypothetical protein
MLKLPLRCRQVIAKRRQRFDQFTDERGLIGAVRRRFATNISRIIMRGHYGRLPGDGSRASSEPLGILTSMPPDRREAAIVHKLIKIKVCVDSRGQS